MRRTLELERVGGLPQSLRAARTAISVDALVVAGLVALAAGPRLWVATWSIESIVAHAAPDDAFYYFQIARNIEAGRGVTFDGEVVTNGFHPLWMAIVSACYVVPAAWIDPLRLTLVVSALIAALGVPPLYQFTKAVAGMAAATAVSLFYAGHPALILQSVNGIETALASTLVLVCLDQFRRALERRTDPVQTPWILGLAGGGVMLARTDYVFFVAPMIAVLAVFSPRKALLAGSVAAACVLPWFVWSYAATGELMQTSGTAVPLIAHRAGPDGLALGHSLSLLREAWWERIPAFYLVPQSWHVTGAIAIVLTVVALGVALLRAPDRVKLLPLALFGASIVALSVVHAGVRWYLRDWYLPALLPFLAMALAAAFAFIPSGAARSAAAGVLLSAGAVSAISYGVEEYREPRYAIQADMLAGARWADEELPADSVIGSFNAGIVGYYSGHEVVNLDGVVDGDALDALRDGELLMYADERCVTHLTDFPFYLYWYNEEWGGPVFERVAPIASFDEAASSQPEELRSGFTVWAFRQEGSCVGD